MGNIFCDWGERFAVKGVLCLTDGRTDDGSKKQVANRESLKTENIHFSLPWAREGAAFHDFRPMQIKFFWGLEDRRGGIHRKCPRLKWLHSCLCCSWPNRHYFWPPSHCLTRATSLFSCALVVNRSPFWHHMCLTPREREWGCEGEDALSALRNSKSGFGKGSKFEE